MSILLNDFISSINQLYCDGLKVKVKDKELKLKVFFAFCLGDTLALNGIGGFLQGVGKARRCCRSCEINILDRKDIFEPSYYHMRTLARHEQLKMIEKMPSLTTAFGVSKKSCLMEVEGFNVSESLLQDPMHILIEVVCLVELSCLIGHFISETPISLRVLNGLIKAFNYAQEDKND